MATTRLSPLRVEEHPGVHVGEPNLAEKAVAGQDAAELTPWPSHRIDALAEGDLAIAPRRHGIPLGERGAELGPVCLVVGAAPGMPHNVRKRLRQLWPPPGQPKLSWSQHQDQMGDYNAPIRTQQIWALRGARPTHTAWGT